MPREKLNLNDQATLLYYQKRSEFFQLGQFYEDKEYIPEALKSYLNGANKKDQNSRAALVRLADQGHMTARYYLGIIYEDDKDRTLAEYHYKIAAKAGDANAMFRIGSFYQSDYHGNNIPTDFLQALEWYYQALCAGSSQAFNRLIEISLTHPQATHYLKLFYKSNPENVLALYLESNEPKYLLRAAQLYAATQNNTYENTQTVWKLYVKAARQGTTDALAPLERLVDEGTSAMLIELADIYHSTFKNNNKAKECLAKAVNLGNKSAEAKLSAFKDAPTYTQQAVIASQHLGTNKITPPDFPETFITNLNMQRLK